MAEIDVFSHLDDPRAAVGAIPIAGTPAGVDLRDDPEFELLEAEFRKMETGGPAAVNWKMLNERTLQVIEKKSKDLVLGSRLAYGLYREEGYKGLAVGISILHGMVSDHWEGLFPPLKRERGRAGSIDWLSERMAAVVETEPPADDRRIFALVAHDRLVELDEQLSQKMQKFPVALGPLVRALRPHARQARAELEARAEADKAAAEAAAAPPPPAQAAASAEAPPAVAAATAAPAQAAAAPAPQPAAQPASAAIAVPAVQTGEGAEKALQSIFSAAGTVASAVRKEAPADPRGYLCARLAVWGPIAAAPPDRAGKSALPPPQKPRLAEIQALRAAGNNQDLLTAAEGVFVMSPFWLDAQYLLAQSMQALGPDYEAARAVVVGQLGAFLRRVPGLTALSFSDGMPFADGDTIAWIGSEVQAGGEGGSSGSELDKVRAAAGRLGQSAQVLAGLKLLTDFAESRFGERERFQARLEIGEFCLRFDLLQPLFPLLAGLRQTAEQRALDVWEPQLAVALASLSWRSVTHKNAKRFLDEKEGQEQRDRVMATLAALDMVMAARLSSMQAG
jgi:type VI secretion system protein VasJ